MLLHKRRSWALALTCAALALALGLARSSPGGGPHFQNVKELQAWAERRGLYCQSDRKDNKVVLGVAVSTRPLTWEAVNRHAFRRDAAERDRAWQGTIWAVNRSPIHDEMPVPPWYGECRVWGSVLATGDPALLDRIERGEP